MVQGDAGTLTESDNTATSMMKSPQDETVPRGVINGVAEGVVTFPSKQESSYRYSIKMKADKMSVWLEDRKTKQQW